MADQDDVSPEVANFMRRESYRFQPRNPDDSRWFKGGIWKFFLYLLLAYILLATSLGGVILLIFVIVLLIKVEDLANQVKILQCKFDLSQRRVSPAELPAVRSLEMKFQQSDSVPTGAETQTPPANDGDAQIGSNG